MTLDERHAIFLAAFALGQAYRCRLDLAEAEHDAAHAAVRPIVSAMVADMNRRGVGDHERIEQRRRARQVEAGERFRAAAIPWPEETAPVAGPFPTWRRELPFQREAS